MPIYQEIWAGPARNYKRTSTGTPLLSSKEYITIHNTSNDASAEGEASYAKVRTDGTSSHYYCDHDSILQSLNTDWCAGHVGSTQGNTYGISYEITGFNGWDRQTWLSNVAWDKLAAQIAVDCREFGIPVRLLTIDEMRAGSAKGFVTHDMCRIAWGGTTHTDPGPGFPMDHLLARVTAVLNGDDDMSAERTSYNADWYLYRGVMQLADEVDGIRVDDADPNRVATVQNGLAKALKGLAADVAELKARPQVQPAPVDPAAVKAALLDPEVLAGIAKAVADEDHRRSKE